MHLVVLLHGLGGSPSELSFVLKAMKWQVSNSDTLVKNPPCNYLKTSDGILAGSKRVFKWILDEMIEQNITHISFIGHSLGGIYARCCIGMLHEHGILPQLLTPVNFITLATPHLGARQHVWIPDKWHALIVSKFLRNQSILELTMTDADEQEESFFFSLVSDYYIAPLQLFPNLVAYGNTVETTVNYNTSTIRRVSKLSKSKFNFPDIILDNDDFGFELSKCAEDKMYQVLKKLNWRRYAVYPKRPFFAHTDIVVREENKDAKHGSHVIEHVLRQFDHPEVVKSDVQGWDEKRMRILLLSKSVVDDLIPSKVSHISKSTDCSN